ncbi:hypothetical protein EVAR_67549_1 [Eumeta japonica]|uniref:Uncharacterized protein n=1 Tax=Eumeta variegata TaxID=151549 RepID=A0A4C1ZZQ5_EUMVA|nr:hypothetical protein EVAR_67549_1 [Eumeta japonica]
MRNRYRKLGNKSPVARNRNVKANPCFGLIALRNCPSISGAQACGSRGGSALKVEEDMVVPELEASEAEPDWCALSDYRLSHRGSTQN